MLDPITNPFTNMKKKCFGAAEIFRSENQPVRSYLDNVEFFFFYKPPFEINQTEIPFTSMGVFSKRRKEDFISSKQPGRPFIDFLAFSAISQC